MPFPVLSCQRTSAFTSELLFGEVKSQQWKRSKIVCSAAKCSNSYAKADVSMHVFPKKPSLRKQWTDFVSVKRVWSGPTEHSHLCSMHFTMDCFPFRQRFEMEHMGRRPKNVRLNKNAVPTIHAMASDSDNSVSKQTTGRLEMLTSTEEKAWQTSPPKKKLRRAFSKRETIRLIREYGMEQASSPHSQKNVEAREEEDPIAIEDHVYVPKAETRITDLPTAMEEELGDFVSVKEECEHEALEDPGVDVPPSRLRHPWPVRLMESGSVVSTSNESEQMIEEKQRPWNLSDDFSPFDRFSANSDCGFMTASEQKHFEDLLESHNDVFGTITTSIIEKNKKMKAWEDIANKLNARDTTEKRRTAEELIAIWSRKLLVDHVKLKAMKMKRNMSCVNESGSTSLLQKAVPQERAILFKAKRFLCSACGRQFSTLSNLRSHQRLKHEKSATYCCEICKQMFVDKGAFTGHMNSHKNIKPYCCAKCKKTYMYVSSLQAHQRSCRMMPDFDKTELVLECSECWKVFTKKKYLNDHLRLTHSETRNYVCKCGQQFRYRSSLKKHRDKQYCPNNEIPQDQTGGISSY